MDIQKIIKQLIYNNVLHSDPIGYEQLNGGTVSELYLLHFGDLKYVVKTNEPQVIKSEANFLNIYMESNLLPKLLFVEKSSKYIVYAFINGSSNYERNNKKELLETLARGLLNHYKSVPNDIGWGWADKPAPTWQSFLMDEIIEANKIINSRLEEKHYNFVLNLVGKISNDRKPFLLHGDCGVHNFIFKNGKLIGVIDPTPVIGDPLYDLIYAFCSSPNDLTKETIDAAVSHLTIKRELSNSFIYEEVLIGLYIRLAASIKHHPSDFDQYLKAWYYWVEVVKTVK